MFIKSCYVLILALAAANSVLAECNNAIPRTTPDQAFTLHDDGTVTHTTTGLMWMRCQLGQTWNGTTCSGSAQFYNWQNALQAASGYPFAGYSDWRVPNKNELASIVELACYSPGINTIAFPNDSARGVWSSSHDGSSSNAWFVSFDYPDVRGINKDSRVAVRLVRGGQ